MFRAETEEDLEKIKGMGVPAMEQATEVLIKQKCYACNIFQVSVCRFSTSSAVKPVAVTICWRVIPIWLSLFRAETEEDLEKIKGMGVPAMEQAQLEIYYADYDCTRQHGITLPG